MCRRRGLGVASASGRGSWHDMCWQAPLCIALYVAKYVVSCAADQEVTPRF
jgi:hypothetical protein